MGKIFKILRFYTFLLVSLTCTNFAWGNCIYAEPYNADKFVRPITTFWVDTDTKYIYKDAACTNQITSLSEIEVPEIENATFTNWGCYPIGDTGRKMAFQQFDTYKKILSACVVGGQYISQLEANYNCNTGYTKNGLDCELRILDITLNLNGASGTNQVLHVPYGQKMPDISIPTRTGYSFKGFYTLSSGSGTQIYDEKGTSEILSQNVPSTIYAKWTINKYTVRFNTGDADGGSPSISSMTCIYDAVCASFANRGSLYKNGYVFAGWTTNEDGTSAGGRVFDSGATGVRMGAGDMDLYPRWTPCDAVSESEGVTITLDTTNGTCSYKGTCQTGYSASGGSDRYMMCTGNGCKCYPVTTHVTFSPFESLPDVTLTYGEKGANITVPTREGYTFLGVFDYSGVLYYDTDGVATREWDKTNVDVTLYVRWQVGGSTITLDNNGGTGGSGAIYSVYNSNVYSDAEHNQVMQVGSNPVTKPTRSYTVTFDANGGNVSSASLTANYTFNGYFSATTGGTKYIQPTGFISSDGLNAAKSYTANQTWYAQWTPGTITLPTPTREGYTFNGWYPSATGGAKVGDAGVAYAPGASITLYAQWTEVEQPYPVTADFSCSSGTTALTMSFKGDYKVLWNNGSPVQSGTINSVNDKVEIKCPSNGSFVLKIWAAPEDYGTADNPEKVNIRFGTGIKKIYGSMFELFPAGDKVPSFYNTFNNTSLNYVDPNLFVGYTKSIPNMFKNTFYKCGSLTNVPTFRTIRTTGSEEGLFYGTFSECAWLTRDDNIADMFAGVTAGAKEMFHGTFSYCSRLEQFPDLSKVTATTGTEDKMFEFTFKMCTKLVSNENILNMFDGITKGAPYMFHETFAEDSGLVQVPTFKNVRTDGSENYLFYGTFVGCSHLTLGDNMLNMFENVKVSAPSMFSNTFERCGNLTKIPNFDSELMPAKNLFWATFLKCNGLTTVPEQFLTLFKNKTFDENVYSLTFKNCTGLQSITMSDNSIAPLDYIPVSVFDGLSPALYSQTFTGAGALVASQCPEDLAAPTDPDWQTITAGRVCGPLPAFSIVYNLDGGTLGAGAPTEYRTSDDSVLPLGTPTKTGFIFDGWCVDAELDDCFTEIPMGTSGDLILYAKWTPVEPDYPISAEYNCTAGADAFEISAVGSFSAQWFDGANNKVGGVVSANRSVYAGTVVLGSPNAPSVFKCPGTGTYTVKLRGVASSGYPMTVGTNGANIGQPVIKFRNGITGINGQLAKIFGPVITVSGTGTYPSFYKTFENCESLTYIDPDLFNGYVGGVSSMFSATFANTGLTEIPADLFRTITNVTKGMFSFTFKNCKSLTSVPGNLFSNITVPKQALFNSTFAGSGLTTVPKTLFSGITTLTGDEESLFYQTFYGCKDLETIGGKELFSNVTGSAKYLFGQVFMKCEKLSEIPAGLFDGINAGAHGQFIDAFNECDGLTTIPDRLFANVTTSAEDMFLQTFKSCTHLSHIPKNLFAKNLTAAKQMFVETFSGCTALETFPASVLTNVSGSSNQGPVFIATFSNDTNLKTVTMDDGTTMEYLPVELFENQNTNLYAGAGTFSGAGQLFRTNACPVGTRGVAEWQNATLGRVCTPVSEYDITYNLNGGYMDEDAPSQYRPSDDSASPLGTPRKRGYVFGGWCTNAALTDCFMEIPAGTSGDLILWAKWDDCPAGSYCPLGTSLLGDDEDDINACPDGYTSNPGAHEKSDCFVNCNSGHEPYADVYHPVVAKVNWPNTCSYLSANGNPCIPQGDGTCKETGCISTFEMIDGKCVACARDHATRFDETHGNCIIAECEEGYHTNGLACIQDEQSCTIPNALDAHQIWDAGLRAFGACIAYVCEDGYHLASNACVIDSETCRVENGLGERVWNATENKWGECQAVKCEPGYTNDAADMYAKDRGMQCGRCANRFDENDNIAASTYIQECEIATCMYHGEFYKLDGNECKPICEDGYSDETGTLQWDAKSGKCIRKCNPGYMTW